MLVPKDFDIVTAGALSDVLCEKLTQQELQKLINLIESEEKH